MYGQKIKEIRKYNNLSQEELGKILGISRASVSELERGNRELKAEEIKKLLEDLDKKFILGKIRVRKVNKAKGRY